MLGKKLWMLSIATFCSAIIPLSSTLVVAQGIVTPGAKPKPAPKPDPVLVMINRLSSPDAAERRATIADLRTKVSHDYGMARAMDRWWESLIDTKDYDSAADIMQIIMVKYPFISMLETALPKRIHVLLAAGKPQDALVAAKQWYNVCRLKQTAGAIDLVSDCLRAAHPDDPTIGTRFRAEQNERANLINADKIDTPDKPGASLLDAIKIDATTYDENLFGDMQENYNSLYLRGNLALLADNPTRARELFERGYAVASPKDASAAAENIAKSIRAMHRSVGAANTWIMSLQQKTSATKDPLP